MRIVKTASEEHEKVECDNVGQSLVAESLTDSAICEICQLLVLIDLVGGGIRNSHNQFLN